MGLPRHPTTTPPPTKLLSYYLFYHWPPSLYKNQIPRKLIASFNLLPEILSRDLPLDQIFPTPLKKNPIFTVKSSNLYTFPHQKLQSVHFSSSPPVFLFILLPESRIRLILGLLLQILIDLLAAGLLV